MEFARKMLLVPAGRPDPAITQMTQLDRQMEAILKNKKLSNFEKMKLYNQVLRRNLETEQRFKESFKNKKTGNPKLQEIKSTPSQNASNFNTFANNNELLDYTNAVENDYLNAYQNDNNRNYLSDNIDDYADDEDDEEMDITTASFVPKPRNSPKITKTPAITPKKKQLKRKNEHNETQDAKIKTIKGLRAAFTRSQNTARKAKKQKLLSSFRGDTINYDRVLDVNSDQNGLGVAKPIKWISFKRN